MLISIIIPVFNEENTVKQVIAGVKNIKLGRSQKKEIVVIDDASTDKTANILRKIKGIKVVTHKKNSGKGGAIKTGFSKAKGDILVIQDADLEYDPKYIPRLLKAMISKKADVVYGTRLKNYPLRISGAKRTPLITHYLGNKFLSSITGILYGAKITDMETGYKMFRKVAVKDLNIEAKRFDLEPEITAKILKAGFKIYEVPISTKPRGYDEGKKITWKDGFIAIWTLLKFKFRD